MAEKLNVYQIVTEKIIEQMEKGIVPWNRPWHGKDGGPINYVTRKPYSFLNQMLLGEDGEYLSYKQIQDLGGKLKPNAQSRIVTFYKRIIIEETNKDGEKKQKLSYMFRYYYVYHLNDVEGIKSKIKEEKPSKLSPNKRADKVINSYVKREKIKFENDKPSNRAYYSPAFDKVVVPMLSQYNIVDEYYSTTFHELTHSTGIKSRCDRGLEKDAAFGSELYSREELVAEIGAAMLVNRVGLNLSKTIKNTSAYLQSWISAIRDDARAIVVASSRAEKAALYIMNEKQNDKLVSEEK